MEENFDRGIKIMQPQSVNDIKIAISQIIEQIPCLKMLVLFGSRVRGDYDEQSDWDFAVLYDKKLRKDDEKLDWDSFKLRIFLEKALNLPEDKIDLVDLETCSPWLKHVVARDGEVLFQEEAEVFKQFYQSSLKSNIELKAYRQSVREKVKSALQRWRA
jgi:predicted nucleotidyltransferase